MGLWFFLSVLVVCRMAFKFYRLKLITRSAGQDTAQMQDLERDLAELRLAKGEVERRLAALEESVFFGEFDLKRQFKGLEHRAERAHRS